jgi:hypothetical protein
MRGNQGVLVGANIEPLFPFCMNQKWCVAGTTMLTLYGNYMLFLVILDIYAEVINMKVTPFNVTYQTAYVHQ